MSKKKSEEFAFDVFDVDMGVIVNRTKRPHKYRFDLDVRKPSARRNFWIYWGSHNSVAKLKQMVSKTLKKALGSDAEARIVEASTGKIVEVIK